MTAWTKEELLKIYPREDDFIDQHSDEFYNLIMNAIHLSRRIEQNKHFISSTNPRLKEIEEKLAVLKEFIENGN